MLKAILICASTLAIGVNGEASESESVPQSPGVSALSAHGANAAGIGALLDLTPSRTVVVKAVPPGTPAYLAGLRPNDMITSVQKDSQSQITEVAGKRLEHVTSMIRGPRGTTVILEVLRPNGETSSLKIQRQ